MIASPSDRIDFHPPRPLISLQTPCLLLDETRMDSNIERLTTRLRGHGVGFRPHLKTAKSLEVARRLVETSQNRAMVSTLREAEVFASAGIGDLIYGVGISPGKLDRVKAIRHRGTNLSIILDSVEQAEAVAAASSAGDPIPVLIEVDCDHHRSGVHPENGELLVAIARALGQAQLQGVLTHAGESYNARGVVALEAAAESERAAAVRSAETLRSVGFVSSVNSVGSTPTAFFGKRFDGITEVRAGVFVFFDLVQAGIGVCRVDEIALSVLTTVIGHNDDKGWTLVDAGWMALSLDRGTAKQQIDEGYGIVCDISGHPIGDLIVIDVNQEHGIVGSRTGSKTPPRQLAVGQPLRILPSHACATAAQHTCYYLIDHGHNNAVSAMWLRFSGW